MTLPRASLSIPDDTRLVVVERILQHIVLPEGVRISQGRIRSTTEAKRRDACWKWVGYSQHGYGYLETGVRAYRVVYELFRGPIPSGLHLHHICHHKWCTNPDHLIPVSRQIHSWMHGCRVARNEPTRMALDDTPRDRERAVERTEAWFNGSSLNSTPPHARRSVLKVTNPRKTLNVPARVDSGKQRPGTFPEDSNAVTRRINDLLAECGLGDESQNDSAGDRAVVLSQPSQHSHPLTFLDHLTRRPLHLQWNAPGFSKIMSDLHSNLISGKDLYVLGWFLSHLFKTPLELRDVPVSSLSAIGCDLGLSGRQIGTHIRRLLVRDYLRRIRPECVLQFVEK